MGRKPNGERDGPPASWIRVCDRPTTRTPLATRGALWYCEGMKNITVSVDDETYRRARMKAAERDTSVSALVREFLQSLSKQESEFDRLAREEQELYARIESFSEAYNLPRDDLHERGI